MWLNDEVIEWFNKTKYYFFKGKAFIRLREHVHYKFYVTLEKGCAPSKV